MGELGVRRRPDHSRVAVFAGLRAVCEPSNGP